MTRVLLLTAVLITFFCRMPLNAGEAGSPIEPSYFKLTTSNGLLAAVYDAKKNLVEYVFPHIFENYDSALFVRPFVGNIRLKSEEQPAEVLYLRNTHVIAARYRDFTVHYFASFTNDNKIFYIVARGKKQTLAGLSFDAETGDGNVLTGISLLTNSHTDLSVRLGGMPRTGIVSRRYRGGVYERYFLYSFTDSLHTDTAVVTQALARLARARTSLLDDEIRFMTGVQGRCRISADLSDRERNVVKQSISFLKMAQVSGREIFPNARGQVLAALRPGLWHVAWVRDGSYAIRAMTRLGMYDEARKGLEFMLKAPSGAYKHFVYKDGKDYGIGVDYQISVCRYYGNGREESTYGGGPNIEIDNFGLFLSAFADYVQTSNDSAFLRRWSPLVQTKVADATIHCIDTNSLIKADSGPWEHYLEMPRQYTFTSGVCARGLEQFAGVQKRFGLPYEKYLTAAETLKHGILEHLLCHQRYFKGNVNDTSTSAHEYYDSGAYEIFANGLIRDKRLFLSHMEQYDKVLRIPEERPGYIRLNSTDPYENQEWVFINLRIALAHLLFGQRPEAARLLNYVTRQAAANYNTIPEMYSNKAQLDKVTDPFRSNDVWCNCLREKGGQFIGAIPMVGYGSGAYVLTILAAHARPPHDPF